MYVYIAAYCAPWQTKKPWDLEMKHQFNFMKPEKNNYKLLFGVTYFFFKFKTLARGLVITHAG